MDIMLERILSLIPRDDDGKYVHGAKAEFAKSIGYNDGAIVSMWIKGTSTSYKNKLHEISEKYGVSVKYLRGETDDPGIKEARATEGEGLNGKIAQFIRSASAEELDEIYRYIDFLESKREKK
nr:MAG TPA: repressor protein [Caudoviricetes sp.]